MQIALVFLDEDQYHDEEARALNQFLRAKAALVLEEQPLQPAGADWRVERDVTCQHCPGAVVRGDQGAVGAVTKALRAHLTLADRGDDDDDDRPA